MHDYIIHYELLSHNVEVTSSVIISSDVSRIRHSLSNCLHFCSSRLTGSLPRNHPLSSLFIEPQTILVTLRGPEPNLRDALTTCTPLLVRSTKSHKSRCPFLAKLLDPVPDHLNLRDTLTICTTKLEAVQPSFQLNSNGTGDTGRWCWCRIGSWVKYSRSLCVHP